MFDALIETLIDWLSPKAEPNTVPERVAQTAFIEQSYAHIFDEIPDASSVSSYRNFWREDALYD